MISTIALKGRLLSERLGDQRHPVSPVMAVPTGMPSTLKSLADFYPTYPNCTTARKKEFPKLPNRRGKQTKREAAIAARYRAELERAGLPATTIAKAAELMRVILRGAGQ
jgi:hypothetical protein